MCLLSITGSVQARPPFKACSLTLLGFGLGFVANSWMSSSKIVVNSQGNTESEEVPDEESGQNEPLFGPKELLYVPFGVFNLGTDKHPSVELMRQDQKHRDFSKKVNTFLKKGDNDYLPLELRKISISRESEKSKNVAVKLYFYGLQEFIAEYETDAASLLQGNLTTLKFPDYPIKEGVRGLFTLVGVAHIEMKFRYNGKLGTLDIHYLKGGLTTEVTVAQKTTTYEDTQAKKQFHAIKFKNLGR